jgi:protein SCO1/2
MSFGARLSVLALWSLAACTAPASGGDATAGKPVAVAIARPDFTLSDTQGEPYAFRTRTAGTLTFLFFGYTNCPDVCPVHLANLGAALARLPVEQRARTRVVFVTVDPDRDSGAVMRKWLAAIDPAFVGLRGDRAALDAAQRSVNLGAATVATVNGKVEVTHASPVVVFTADDSAHVMYPFGTRQQDWVRDLPALLARGSK